MSIERSHIITALTANLKLSGGHMLDGIPSSTSPRILLMPGESGESLGALGLFWEYDHPVLKGIGGPGGEPLLILHGSSRPIEFFDSVHALCQALPAPQEGSPTEYVCNWHTIHSMLQHQPGWVLITDASLLDVLTLKITVDLGAYPHADLFTQCLAPFQ